MEDIEIILTLLIALLYFTFQNVQRRDVQPEEVARDPVHRSASASVDNRKAPVDFLKVPFEASIPVNTTKQAPYTHTQPVPNKKINRILSRYGTWQRAIIMQELIKPYDERTSSLLP